MKNFLKIFIITLCFNLSHGQNIVNFSSDEGFSNDVLNNQTNWYAHSGWSVDAVQGLVTTTAEWQRAAWKKPFSLSEVGDQITFRVDLNFTGTLTNINQSLIYIGFSASSVAESPNTLSNKVYLSSSSDGEALRLRNNTNGVPLSSAPFLLISDCQGTNGTTKDLAVIVTLTLGADEGSSTISAKLLNVTDGTSSSLGSYNGIETEVFNASTSSIYGVFSSAAFKNNTNLTAINVKKVSMTRNIDIFPKIKRLIGGTSTLDRSKYFNIHSGSNDVDNNLYTDYNVSQSGRQFYGAAGYNKSTDGTPTWAGTGTVGVYPDPISGGNTDLREVRRYVATDHPYNVYYEGLDPIAFADWTVEYYKNLATTKSRPEYYEPMNEPFVHARDYYDEPDWDPVAEARVKLEMAQFFKHIAQKIHAAPELRNMKILGYSAAFPSFEKADFFNWNNNMKMFMDTAGADVDIFSTHLYDGINQIGQETRRSGSNMEAILDLIETYSYSKWGVVKPHAITEFGGIEIGTYTTEATFDVVNVQSIRSQNSILFGLLERTDRMEIAIPFTTGRAEWHITAENNYMPYKASLYKPIPFGVPLNQVTGWEYTDRIHFYDLWKDVSGDRILIRSDNVDVLVQAFANGNKLYVALNNLDDFDQPINLNLNGNLPNITELKIKSLIIHPDIVPDYTIQTSSIFQETFTLNKNETVVMEYTFSDQLVFDNSIESKSYYSNQHLQPIQANTQIDYDFNGVTLGNSGFAKLSMSIGRTHDKSKSPSVIFNGSTIPVPSNWKGYNQANRTDFFGALEIPVPITLIQQNNTVSIKFNDSEGHLSSLVLNVEAYDSSDVTWNGSLSSNWASGANWDINLVPFATNNVIIPDVATAPIIGPTTGAVTNDLTIIEPDGINITAGGSLIVSGTSTGNVTYNRTIDFVSDNLKGWYLMASPVVGQVYNDAYVTANDIAVSNSNRGIATYTTAAGSWNYHQGASSATFTAGKGYSVKRGTNTGTVSFTGTLNTSDAGVDFLLENTGNRINLLGNPYTSYINSATLLDNAALSETKTMWVYNQTIGTNGGYEVKTFGQNFILAPGQGFFVTANAAGGTVNFAEANQSNNLDTFQKTASKEIKVKISVDDGFQNYAKVYYLDNATTGFDVGYEGELFEGATDSFSIYSQLLTDNIGKKYQVQSLPNSNYESMVIPIGVIATAGKEITLSADAVNLPGDTKVFLEDRNTNIFTRLDEASSDYKITLTENLNGIGRFYLHTKSSVLSTNDVVLDYINVYKTNNSTLRIVGLPQGISKVKIFNILGKQILNSSFTSNGVQDISLPKVAAGIYIVQLETETGKLNKKITLE